MWLGLAQDRKNELQDELNQISELVSKLEGKGCVKVLQVELFSKLVLVLF